MTVFPTGTKAKAVGKDLVNEATGGEPYGEALGMDGVGTSSSRFKSASDCACDVSKPSK